MIWYSGRYGDWFRKSSICGPRNLDRLLLSTFTKLLLFTFTNKACFLSRVPAPLYSSFFSAFFPCPSTMGASASTSRNGVSSESVPPTPQPQEKLKAAKSSTLDDYQVFLSFRGPDTRNSFTDVLYDHMANRAGIRVFKDEDEIPLGQPIDEVLQAIENSEICVPILSESFASSAWCLREVEKMVQLEKMMIPIFYKISPDDVKLKNDHPFNKAMKVHEEKHGKDQVEKWKSALKKIAELKGMEFSADRRYTEFCREIVNEILSKLKPRKRLHSGYLVGMDSQIGSMMKLVDIESPGIWCIGIHGMQGIGKSTLAKALFAKLSSSFDCSCFLKDVRESLSSSHGLPDLQKQLLVRLDPELTRGCISFVDIEERFQKKKVLIVLDDVDKAMQIEQLVGQSTWFGSGSRIIVTTTHIDILKRYGKSNQIEVRFFEMNTLKHDQALKLFQWHAFGEEKPPTILETISREIVQTVGGLPLALKVIGSRLFSVKDERVWKEVMERSKEVQDMDVKERLIISYEVLEEDQQKIFLDIACLRDMEEKVKSMYMWEASKLYPHLNLAVLSSMSLVKLKGDKIWMHSLLKDLGKHIARRNRTRVWKNEETLEVLLSKEGKEQVEALYIDKPLEVPLTHEHFTSFQKLRFLKLTGANIEGDFNNLLPRLSWFSWHLCPPILSTTNLNMKNLVVLDLSFSFISESWGGWSLIQILNNLKVLDLSNCHNLTRTPDFSHINCLERLELRHCTSLLEIHGSIGKVQSLKYVNLIKCYSLHGLPDEICCLVNLEMLRVSGSRRCKFRNDFHLPRSIGQLQSLSVLELEQLNIGGIPDSIGELAKLKVLSLNGCSMVKLLPESLGKLESLQELNLSYCRGITALPNSIGGLVKLKVLNMCRCSSLRILHESVVQLQELKVLNLSGSQVINLPVNIESLKKLEVIDYHHYGGYNLMKELPMGIGSLSSLKMLILNGSKISMLPSTVDQLKHLEVLDLGQNHELQELPDLPLSLSKLRVSSKLLKKNPDLLRLTNLTELMLLNFDDYTWPQQLPSSKFEGIENLTKLKSLRIGPATALQFDFVSLTVLGSLGIDFQPNSEAYPPLPSAGTSSLEIVDISEPQMNLKLPDLSSMENLSSLSLRNCFINDGLENTLGIQHLRNLKRLYLTNCGVELFGFICMLTNLRSLGISGCGSLKTLSNLSELRNLSYLSVYNCKGVDEIIGLGNLESLERLSITLCGSLEKLENLSKLVKLHAISLTDCSKIRTIEGTDKIILSWLSIQDCGSLQNVDELQKMSKRGKIDGVYFENFR